MPVYEYSCDTCKRDVRVTLSISEHTKAKVACPRCGKPMGRVAAYACLKCQISSDAPGPCPTCHEPMQSLAALYRHCPTCGFYYSRSKKSCPVCAKRHKARHR